METTVTFKFDLKQHVYAVGSNDKIVEGKVAGVFYQKSVVADFDKGPVVRESVNYKLDGSRLYNNLFSEDQVFATLEDAAKSLVTV